MQIAVKRIYEGRASSDGFRVLVDRIWPRGLTKEKAAVDLWLREAAPSTALRTWFGHDPTKWEAFQERYARELDERPDIIAQLHESASTSPLTLVYSARDREHNQAVALRAYLLAHCNPVD